MIWKTRICVCNTQRFDAAEGGEKFFSAAGAMNGREMVTVRNNCLKVRKSIPGLQHWMFFGTMSPVPLDNSILPWIILPIKF